MKPLLHCVLRNGRIAFLPSISLSAVNTLKLVYSGADKLTGGSCHFSLGRPPPWLEPPEKLQQKVPVAGVRAVIPVGIFLAQQPRFFKVLDGSPDGFIGDAEILGDPFHAGPGLTLTVTAVLTTIL